VFKLTRYLAAPGAVFLVAVGLSACGGVSSNAVVQVGGMPITKTAFAHWMEVAAASSSPSSATEKSKPVAPDPPDFTACIAHLEASAPKPAKGQPAPTKAELKSQCEQQYKSIQQEVLGFLISSQWVIAEGAHLGVKVSDQEVKKQFEQLKNAEFPKAEDFEKFLANSGQTVSDVLLRVKLNLLSTKIQQKIVKTKSQITHAQIAKYYNENPSRFGVPEKRDIRVILTKTEAAAKKAREEIESGQSFASVAKRVSIEPISRSSGGLIPGITKGEEQKPLDQAIFSATKLNVVGGPIKTPFGYYVYEVVKITAGTHQTLAQSESAVKQQLTSTQEQAALNKFVKEFKKKWMAETDCRAGYVVPDCKQYKAPKAGATGTEHP
jgi:parvulin-like peptidyl-prolyl isomerase